MKMVKENPLCINPIHGHDLHSETHWKLLFLEPNQCIIKGNISNVNKHGNPKRDRLYKQLHFSVSVSNIVSSSFYSKVSDLHAELYNSPETALTNPLVAFTLIKRLQSEWLNVISSNEALENAQGLNLAFFADASGGDKCTHPPASAVITHRPPCPR